MSATKNPSAEPAEPAQQGRAPRRRRDASADQPAANEPARNEVVLLGRVAAPAQERELPSGDSIMTARIIVDRDDAARAKSAQRVDTIDCLAWTSRVHRSMRNWQPGDRVLVEGAIRRRFYRSDAGSVSRVEVEIRSARRV